MQCSKGWLSCVAAMTIACGMHAQKPYQVIDHWKIGGEGGWDYLRDDAAAHRLYIAHMSRVDVVDTDTGKLVGEVADLKKAHGIALDETGQFGYISDGLSNDVVVFDTGTLRTVTRIPAGANPDGIVYEPVTKSVWVFNGKSNSASVIDTETRKVVATVPLPGKPEFPQADGKGRVFDNLESKNSIAVLDARSKKLTAVWPLSGCESPSGLSYDAVHGRLFAACDGNALAIVDASSGKQIGTAHIGDGPDADRYDAKHDLAFVSTEDGVMTIVDAAHGYRTLETLPTMKGARTMAYDSTRDRLYTVSAEYKAGPDAAAANHRPSEVLPGTFQVIVIGRK